MEQIEAMLAEDPDDAFLRYGLAMEHASSGDDAACVEVLRDLIARTAATAPYVPAYLQAGQALVRLDRITEACDVLRQGVDVARRVGDSHAQGEMQGLLESVS
jgi:thioredoxin-like negative regulator of GroEL